MFNPFPTMNYFRVWEVNDEAALVDFAEEFLAESGRSLVEGTTP